MTDPPRCRRCKRPLRTDASDRGGLGLGCWRLLRRRRAKRRAELGFPPLRAYRSRQIPGQTEIPIEDRNLT